jgi:hypothetical protein
MTWAIGAGKLGVFAVDTKPGQVAQAKKGEQLASLLAELLFSRPVCSPAQSSN